jgi:hypothetical protein
MLLLKLCAKLNFALKNEKLSILAPLRLSGEYFRIETKIPERRKYPLA